MDLYTAERLVAYKQEQLLAEARLAALEPAWVREAVEHLLSIRALGAAGNLLVGGMTQVWKGGVKGAAALVRAGR